MTLLQGALGTALRYADILLQTNIGSTRGSFGGIFVVVKSTGIIFLKSDVISYFVVGVNA